MEINSSNYTTTQGSQDSSEDVTTTPTDTYYSTEYKGGMDLSNLMLALKNMNNSTSDILLNQIFSQRELVKDIKDSAVGAAKLGYQAKLWQAGGSAAQAAIALGGAYSSYKTGLNRAKVREKAQEKLDNLQPELSDGNNPKSSKTNIEAKADNQKESVNIELQKMNPKVSEEQKAKLQDNHDNDQQGDVHIEAKVRNEAADSKKAEIQSVDGEAAKPGKKIDRAADKDRINKEMDSKLDKLKDNPGLHQALGQLANTVMGQVQGGNVEKQKAIQDAITQMLNQILQSLNSQQSQVAQTYGTTANAASQATKAASAVRGG